MTTKYKVMCGFFVLMCLLVAVTVLGYVKLYEASQGFAAYRVDSRVSVAANGADALLREVQDQLSRFRLDLDQAHLRKASALIDRALNFYLANAREAESNPEDIALLDRQIARINELIALTDIMQQKLSAGTRLADERLDALGRAMGEGLHNMSETALVNNNIRMIGPIDEAYISFSNARVWVRHYADIFLDASAVKAEQHMAGFGEALKKIEAMLIVEEGRKAYAVLHKNYTEYAEGFKSARSLFTEGLQAQRRIDAIGAELIKNFDDYTAKAEQSMNTVGPAVQASNEQGQKLIVAAGAVGIILGVLFALFIVLGLIKVLKELGVFAGAVAQGDFTYRIAICEKGEIGDMIEDIRQIPAVLQSILSDYQRLEKRIEGGELDAKGDPAAYKGGFSTLVAGTNAILSRFLLLVENIPSPVVVLDKDLKASYVNAACREVAGVACKGKTCKQLMAREDFGSDADALRKAVESLCPASGETRAHPQGGDMDVSYTAIPFLNQEGKLVSVLQLITDLTAIKRAERTIRSVADQAASIADRVAAASEELSAQTEQVSRGADMQRERLESTATAMNEMNATVLEVARNAGHASGQSEETRKKADGGAELVDKVVRSINGVNAVARALQDNMEELGQQAESIGGVMNVISDIADQTNLLALNAAIEAARAGEAGRGFAVVADEVRKLAEKTMDATKEVGDNIQAIQYSARTNIGEVSNAVQNIGGATELANASGQALHEIVVLASSNSTVVASIAAAAEEQSAASEEINTSLEEVSRIAAETAGGMVQASSAVQDLAQTAQQLKSVMERLR